MALTNQLSSYTDFTPPKTEAPMKNFHESIILGAGPAGLQLGYYFQRDGRDYQILERGQRPGGFFEVYPRHRKLISINKVHTGSDDPELKLRHDWNSLLTDDYSLTLAQFTDEFFPTATALLDYLATFAERYELDIRYDAGIHRISRTADGFCLEDNDGSHHTCRNLIVATGLGQPYIPEIPGIELAENYADVSIDPKDFINQRVLIIGKGNSAFETADNLIATAAVIHLVSPEPLEFAWKTHFVGDLRAVNNNLLDTYQLKSQNAVLDAETLGVRQKSDGRLAVQFKYQHAEGEMEELVYDRVIGCTGFRFDASIFDPTTRPELAIRDKFPSLTCQWESTNQPGMYFIGTLMQMRDYRRTTSGFIHGFRYNVQAFNNLFAEKEYGVPCPFSEHACESKVLTEKLLSRVNGSSALWQQQSFLCDVIAVTDSGPVRYYSGLPVAYVRQRFIDDHQRCFVLTLEFGAAAHDQDPFRVNRIRRDNIAQAADSTFLHPAIREYENGVQVSEHHIIEDLEAVWREPEHTQPLSQYLAQRLTHLT